MSNWDMRFRFLLKEVGVKKVALLVGGGCAVALVIGYGLLRDAEPEESGAFASTAGKETGAVLRGSALPQRGQEASQPVPRRFSSGEGASGESEIADIAAKRPTSVEDAVALNPHLAEYLEGQDAQVRHNLDYRLRLVDGMRDCVGDRVGSEGYFFFVLKFDNDPATREAVGNGIDLRDSQLSKADDQVVIECLESVHQDAAHRTSETFGSGENFYMPSGLTFPLEQDQVYRIIRDGDYDTHHYDL